METKKVLVKVDCYPSQSRTALRWLANAFNEAGVKVVTVEAGEKYMFGCWDAWVTIPQDDHTPENETRVMDALRRLYQINNPDKSQGPESNLIRGMIFQWEGDDDAN